MSTAITTSAPSTTESTSVTVRSWKAPIAFAIFTVIGAALFLGVGRGGDTTYRLSDGRDAIQLPALVLPSYATGIVTVILMAAAAVGAFLLVRAARKVPLWLTTVFALIFLLGFLTWAAAGATVPLVGLLAGALTVSTPLIFGALGGVDAQFRVQPRGARHGFEHRWVVRGNHVAGQFCLGGAGHGEKLSPQKNKARKNSTACM